MDHFIPRQRFSDTIYQNLKNRIENGELTPKEHLGESLLANQFHTSQGPVREALSRLEQEGLIEKIPFKGSFVKEIDDEEILKIFELRMMLEGLALKWFIQQIDSRAIAALQEHVDGMKQAADKKDIRALVEKDMSFHQGIIDAAKSSDLLSMWLMLYSKTRMAIANNNRLPNQDLNIIVKRHQNILDFIARRERDQAIAANNKHLACLLENINKDLTTNPFWMKYLEV